MKQDDQEYTQLQEAAAAQLAQSAKPKTRSADELLHELHMHRIGPDKQNDALRVALIAFEDSLENYVDLYDQSPVGYCTISDRGLILQANITAAALLGIERQTLARLPFTRFIFKSDLDIYHLLCKKLSGTDEPQECELRIVKNDGAQFWAHLSAGAAKDADGKAVMRIVLSDISERKRLEEALIFVAEERQRSLGQELHDSLGQQLAAIAYQSSALEKKLLTSFDAGSAGIAASIAAQAQQALMQCRQLAQSMLPFELETNGLATSLQAFASRIAITYEISCDFICPNEVVIDDASLALNLYRIAQEAVNNAIRHGGARHLTISLDLVKGSLCLSIADDGCGFVCGNYIATSGMGIKIMQCRANQSGAILEFTRSAEGGTEVRLKMRKTFPC